MSFTRKYLEQVKPYQPGEQPRHGELFIKLNTNENPYPPSPKVLDALKKAIEGNIRLYPDPSFTDARKKIAQTYRLSASQVILGNGSDEVLSLIIRAFVEIGEEIITLYPSYELFNILAQLNGIRVKALESEEDFTLPEEIYQARSKALFLANPNSPTGIHFPISSVERLCQRDDGLIVVDEAYVDFAPQDCIGLLERYQNLILVKSLSKSYSLAGLRVGFALGHPELIEVMMKIKDSYNVNLLSQVACCAALEDLEHMMANLSKIMKTKERLVKELKTMGFYTYPSSTNFILTRPPGGAARRIYQNLKEMKILVRFFDQRRLQDCLRISIGTDQEVDTLIEALKTLRDREAF